MACLRWIELGLIITKLLVYTVDASGADFWQGQWTGLRICVDQPREACHGLSACAPCNHICRDVLDFARTRSEWRVGYFEYDNGVPNHIAIVRALPDRPTPYIEVVRNGVTTQTVVGYEGDQDILSLCPVKPAVRATVSRTTTVRQSPKWTWPGDLLQHLASEHGYSMAYLQTLSTSQLQSLHDAAHNSVAAQPTIGTSRVTRRVVSEPVYVQSTWVESPVANNTTIYLPPVNYYSMPVQRTYSSQGVQAFGMPLFGTYRSGGSCPGGVCW